MTKRNIIIAILAILSWPALYFVQQKYQDWDNRNLIKGITQDFPALIANVENNIDYPLSISGDCMQTTEKFSSGVSLCGLTVSVGEENSKNIDFNKMIKYFESKEQTKFSKSRMFYSKSGYKYVYKNKQICGFSYKDTVYIDCAFGIRGANKPLAKKFFKSETLNARKDQILQELRNQ